MKIAVTGSTGFIGTALIDKLLEHESDTIVIFVREINPLLDKRLIQIEVGDLSSTNKDNLSQVFKQISGFDVFIHLLGVAHFKRKAIERVNLEVSKIFVLLAKKNKIRKFIFMSSIGVNGISSNTPINEKSIPNPHNKYSKLKLEVEKFIYKELSESDTKFIIIRPPLVYALNAKGNFSRLKKMIETFQLLPFDKINNSKSFISLENLIEFILLCVRPKIPELSNNQVFVVSDDNTISTTDFIKKISEVVNHYPKLIYVNKKILHFFFLIVGMKDSYLSVFGSLVIDNKKAKEMLNWQPSETKLKNIEHEKNI